MMTLMMAALWSVAGLVAFFAGHDEESLLMFICSSVNYACFRIVEAIKEK